MDAVAISTLDRYLAAQRARHLDQLMEFVAIPSVGADPERREDMGRAADWLVGRLRDAGVPAVEAIPTPGHPVVWGKIAAAAPAAPTVLVYGHYDTQPADARDGWTSPPFAPVIRDGRLYGRGASDDKGNLLLPINAVEAYIATGTPLPVGVVFIIEGEEESGSVNFPAFLERHRARLVADVAISADSAMWSNETPSLMLGSRGSIGLQIDARGPMSDLHSGLHGGMAPNPLSGLATLVAGMFTAAGEVAIAGFYDGVRPLSKRERAEITAVPFDEAAYRHLIGADALAGESGYTPLERNWVRPTLDINGLWGGYQGAGGKAVIPSAAHAKISCRLVPDQDPAAVIAAIERHVQRHQPPGIAVTVRPRGSGVPAYTIAPGHPALRATREALAAAYGREPLAIRISATLPFAEHFRAILGLETIGLAWEMPDENLHGVDEFLRLENYERGVRVYADVFARIAAQLSG